MSILSRAFGQRPGLPSWASLDEEALRLAAALQHIERHGNLDAFPESPSGKQALMATAQRRGLLAWNPAAARYEPTAAGRRLLGVRERPSRIARPVPLPRAHPRFGSPFSPGALIASGACVVLGIGVMAATLRSFDVEPQQLGGIPNRTASRQDMAARTAGVPRQEPAPAPGTGFGHAKDPEAPVAIPPKQPALRAESAPPLSVAAPPAVPERPAIQQESAPAPAVASQESLPNPASAGRAASAHPIGTTHHLAQESRNAAESARATKSEAGPRRSRAEARANERRTASSGARDWASAKPVEVIRKGLLVREQRALPDGKFLVRYQYGNGPARFEIRSKESRDRVPGYAFAGEHLTRFGRFEWLR